jgi:integrase
MVDMPRTNWPHLIREVSRHGTVRWVIRLGHHGPRIPIREPYGTPDFEKAYHAALAAEAPQRPRLRRGRCVSRVAGRPLSGKLGVVIARQGDERQRTNNLKHVLDRAADMPYREVTRALVIDGRERRAKTPSQANNFLNTVRSLFRWAVEQEFLESDPTEGVKIVKRPKTGGFKEAIEDDIARFEARWPKGTREYLALTIFLETGLRRGDAARVGRQHMKGGKVEIRTEKTGQLVRIPISEKLAAAIEATPNSGLAFITKADGTPLTKESLGNWMHDACKAARVQFSAHGLRKAAAARLVDIGLTEAELEQIMGWAPGSGMARIYTRRRDANVLADRVADKMKIERRTITAQPLRKVGRDDQ